MRCTRRTEERLCAPGPSLVERCEASLEALDVFPDLLELLPRLLVELLRRPRQAVQIALEIAQGAGIVVELVGEQAAIAQLDRGGRVEREQQMSCRIGLRERAAPHVQPLQV